jgi:hypothetical protein
VHGWRRLRHYGSILSPTHKAAAASCIGLGVPGGVLTSSSIICEARGVYSESVLTTRRSTNFVCTSAYPVSAAGYAPKNSKGKLKIIGTVSILKY